MSASTARLLAPLAAIFLLFALATGALARVSPEDLPAVALADLPREARECFDRIVRGGPFPYERDGVAFGNRERHLPAKPGGYYREYTVRTPGASNRGARRLVCGGPPRAPDVCYYTDDHYRSFRKIRE